MKKILLTLFFCLSFSCFFFLVVCGSFHLVPHPTFEKWIVENKQLYGFIITGAATVALLGSFVAGLKAKES